MAALASSARDARAEEASPQSPATEPPLLPELPISFAVAKVDGIDVVSGEWIDERLLWANLIYWPHGVSFDTAERRPLAERFARLETRQDRHDLGAETKARVINCFVVASLRDVDDPSRYRRGVHWRPEGYPGVHFVVLSSIAGPTVLAHELGHFLGNHRHSDVPGNIMSYTRGDDPPDFDQGQVAILRRHVVRFLKTGELVP